MRRSIVAREEARLQFSDPVPTCRHAPSRVACQMALESLLVELGIVEGAEVAWSGPECSNKTELRLLMMTRSIAPKPAFRAKVEAVLSFTLHLDQRIAGREKMVFEMVAGCMPHNVRSPILLATSKP